MRGIGGVGMLGGGIGVETLVKYITTFSMRGGRITYLSLNSRNKNTRESKCT
jgi:hypothetical protein